MRLFAALLAAISVFTIINLIVTWRQPRARRPKRQRDRVSAEVRLRQAGIPISPARYRMTVAGSMAATLVVVYVVTTTMALALAGAVVVGWAPRAYWRRQREKELADRVAAWPEAIRDVLAQIAVGATLHRALVRLADAGPEPLRQVWANYRRNSAVLDVPTALALVRAELADPVSDQVIEALETAHDRGHTVVVSVLRSLADATTADVHLREKILTGQTEIRSQAALVVMMPFVVLAVLISQNEEFSDFYRSGGGVLVIGIGVGLSVLGWKLITTLGRIPTPPRVLERQPGQQDGAA